MHPKGLNYEETNALLTFLAMNSISRECSRLASFRLKPLISLYLGEAHFGSENTVLFASQASVCVAARALTLLLVIFSLSSIAHTNSASINLKWAHGNALFFPQYSVWISNFGVLYFCLSICSSLRLELSGLPVIGKMESICRSHKSNQHLSPIRERRFLLVINVGSGCKHLHTEPSFVILQITQKRFCVNRKA